MWKTHEWWKWKLCHGNYSLLVCLNKMYASGLGTDHFCKFMILMLNEYKRSLSSHLSNPRVVDLSHKAFLQWRSFNDTVKVYGVVGTLVAHRCRYRRANNRDVNGRTWSMLLEGTSQLSTVDGKLCGCWILQNWSQEDMRLSILEQLALIFST